MLILLLLFFVTIIVVIVVAFLLQDGAGDADPSPGEPDLHLVLDADGRGLPRFWALKIEGSGV